MDCSTKLQVGLLVLNFISFKRIAQKLYRTTYHMWLVGQRLLTSGLQFVTICDHQHAGNQWRSVTLLVGRSLIVQQLNCHIKNFVFGFLGVGDVVL